LTSSVTGQSRTRINVCNILPPLLVIEVSWFTKNKARNK